MAQPQTSPFTRQTTGAALSQAGSSLRNLHSPGMLLAAAALQADRLMASMMSQVRAANQPPNGRVFKNPAQIRCHIDDTQALQALLTDGYQKALPCFTALVVHDLGPSEKPCLHACIYADAREHFRTVARGQFLRELQCDRLAKLLIEI